MDPVAELEIANLIREVLESIQCRIFSYNKHSAGYAFSPDKAYDKAKDALVEKLVEIALADSEVP